MQPYWWGNQLFLTFSAVQLRTFENRRKLKLSNFSSAENKFIYKEPILEVSILVQITYEAQIYLYGALQCFFYPRTGVFLPQQL